MSLTRAHTHLQNTHTHTHNHKCVKKIKIKETLKKSFLSHLFFPLSTFEKSIAWHEDAKIFVTAVVAVSTVVADQSVRHSLYSVPVGHFK
jgi:hypothetical protein